MIVRMNVAPPDGVFLVEATRGDRELDALWEHPFRCPACGTRIAPVRWAYVCWNVGGGWTDGHVEVACPPCGIREVHAFDLTPLARFPTLAAALVGIDLDAAGFAEELTTDDGEIERKARVRTWTAGAVTLRLRHGYETNHPPNEMQWFFNHDSSGELVGQLTVRDDLRAVTASPELAARWRALVAP